MSNNPADWMTDLSDDLQIAKSLRERGTDAANHAADTIEKLCERIVKLESAIVPCIMWEYFTMDDMRRVHECFPNGPGPVHERGKV